MRSLSDFIVSGFPTARAASLGPFAVGLFGLFILTGTGLTLQSGIAEAASTSLAGKRITCGRGKVGNLPVVGALGAASRGRIWLDRKGLSRLPRAVQHYVFLHECAHQYMRGEADADCWAVKRGKYRGLFTARSIDTICNTVSRWHGGGTHPPGPARCKYMRQCFKEGPSPRRGRR